MLFSLVKGVASLITAIFPLFSGISCGVFSVNECLSCYEDFDEYTALYFRGYAVFGIIYSIIAIFLSGHDEYYDGFIIAMAFFLLGFMICVLGAAATTNVADSEGKVYFFFTISIIPLIIKLPHTAYYTVNNILNDSFDSDRYSFIKASLIVELLLLLFWSLIHALMAVIKEIMHSDRNFVKNMPLTVWALEYTDIVSHIIVCCLYASSIDNGWENEKMAAYFAFFVINLYLFVLGLPFAMTDKSMMRNHVMIVDIVTDVPMFLITVIGRTYYHATYIGVDFVLKIVVFMRGVVYVPFFTCGTDGSATKS